MNKGRTFFYTALTAGLLGSSVTAHAHLAAIEIFDFDNGVSVSGATATTTQMPAAVSPAFSQYYTQHGIQHSAIGFGTAPGDSIGNFGSGFSHLHGETHVPTNSRTSVLEADAGGGFFRLLDGDEFSVHGMDVIDLTTALVGGGNTTLTLRGYTAPDFSTFHDEIITPAASGTHLHLDGVHDFETIYMLEYFFTGVGRAADPSANPAFANLHFQIDNIEFGPPAVGTHVPVPAAVYLLGSALSGLVATRRRK